MVMSGEDLGLLELEKGRQVGRSALRVQKVLDSSSAARRLPRGSPGSQGENQQAWWALKSPKKRAS
jgi:hypothetical protein